MHAYQDANNNNNNNTVLDKLKIVNLGQLDKVKIVEISDSIISKIPILTAANHIVS